MKTLARAVALLSAGYALTACHKPEDKPHRTEPWLAHASAVASAPSSAPLDFRFAPESRVRFKLVGRKGQLTGSAPVSDGSLQLYPRDLTRSHATVVVDLTALVLDEPELPEGLDLGGVSPSALAQQWLELGSEVAPERREQFRFARFELSSVEGWSGAPLDVYAHKKAPAPQRVTAVGTLLLHGFRAPVRTDLTLSPTAGPDGWKLAIQSGSVLVLPLAPHDVRARGPGGVVDAVANARTAQALGKDVRIELQLVAQQLRQ